MYLKKNTQRKNKQMEHLFRILKVCGLRENPHASRLKLISKHLKTPQDFFNITLFDELLKKHIKRNVLPVEFFKLSMTPYVARYHTNGRELMLVAIQYGNLPVYLYLQELYCGYKISFYQLPFCWKSKISARHIDFTLYKNPHPRETLFLLKYKYIRDHLRKEYNFPQNFKFIFDMLDKYPEMENLHYSNVEDWILSVDKLSIFECSLRNKTPVYILKISEIIVQKRLGLSVQWYSKFDV